MVKKGALRSCRLLQPLLLLPPRAGASLASPLADGLSPSPLLRGKRAFGWSRFSILQASRLDGYGKPVKCSSQVVEAPRGAPSLRRRPWPRQNALNLPQQPRSQHLVVHQDARAVSSRPAPRWGLRPPARAPAAGTRTRSPFALTRPRAPFPTPLPPSAAEREPCGRMGTRPDAPRGAEARSARPPDSQSAPGAARGSRPAGTVNNNSFHGSSVVTYMLCLVKTSMPFLLMIFFIQIPTVRNLWGTLVSGWKAGQLTFVATWPGSAWAPVHFTRLFQWLWSGEEVSRDTQHTRLSVLRGGWNPEVASPGCRNVVSFWSETLGFISHFYKN